MNRKVVLINAIAPIEYTDKPETIFKMRRGPHFPLGISQIGTYLRERLPELSLTLLDDQILTRKQIINKIKLIKPDIVGINSVFANYEKALIIARESKKSGAKVVMGGSYPTAVSKEILVNRGQSSDDYCVDFVIRGSGEEPLYQFISGKPLSSISNVVYFQKEHLRANRAKNFSFIYSLPNSEIINPETYFKKYQKRFPNLKYKRPFIVQSQKGCAWRSKTKGGCLFCSLVDKKYLAKDPKEIWIETNQLVDRYDIDYIWDVSDDLLSNRQWFDQYYREWKKSRSKPYLKIQSRVSNLVDRNIVQKLSEMKVEPVFVGIESNDDRCLKSIGKGTTSSMNEKAVGLLSKYDVPINAYFVLGNPGENKKSLSKTVKLAERIMKLNKKNVVVPLLFTPLPNSPSFQMVLKKTGRKYKGKDVINWRELIEDWISLFCRAPHREIIESHKYMRHLSTDINVFSF